MSTQIKTLILAVMGLILALPASALASPKIGEPAPAFTGTDIDGNTFTLQNQKGKIVVLEWTNHDCPFVKKHYGTGNMQATQKAATDQGIIWVSIVSSAPGNQGHVTPEEAKKIIEETGVNGTTRILDPTGEIGHLYEAKTTPHMFVIDKSGILAYMGAIDDQPSANPATIKDAQNYVLKAIDELMKDEPVTVSSTKPYGCSVKY